MLRTTTIFLAVVASLTATDIENCGPPSGYGICPTGCVADSYGYMCIRISTPPSAIEAPCAPATDPTPTCPAGSSPGQEVDGLCCCAGAPSVPATAAPDVRSR